MASLTNTLSQVQESKGANADHLEIVERIKEIHQLLIEKIENLSPNLVVLNTLDAINKNVDSQIGNLSTYMGNGGDISNLNKANGLAENILHLIAALPSPAIQVDIVALRKDAATYHKKAGRHLQEIEEVSIAIKAKREELVNSLQSLTTEISAQKGRLDAAIAEFQSQFSKAESTRSDQFTQAESTRLNQFIESRESIDAALAALQKQLLETTESSRATFGQFLKDANQSRLDFETTQELVSRGYINELKTQKEKAEEIVHVISNTGMVGGYQSVANEERKRASIWQLVTVGSLLGLAVVAIWAYWVATHTQFNWGLFSSRIFVAVPFGILAAYAARQAEKHQDLQRRNRRVELELASIDPYLLPLPEDERHEVKRQLAERLFGQSESIQSGKLLDTSATTADVVKVVLEAVKATLEQMAKK